MLEVEVMSKERRGPYVAPQLECWNIPYCQSVLESKSVTDMEAEFYPIEGEEEFK